MNKNTNIIIISGPNTGGKTVVLKSLGLYVLMAQSGLFIPAKYAELPIFKNVLTDIGDKQSIADELNIKLNQRPEQLSSETYYKIAKKYEKLFN